MHSLQNPVAPNLGAFWVDQRVVRRGGFGQACNHGDLRKVEGLDVLSVVDLGGCGDAIGPVAEKNLVQIKLQYFLFCQLPLDFYGEKNFFEFSLESAFVAEEKVLGHLHGDGAAPGLDVTA